MLVATLIIAVVLVVSAWPAAAAATPLPTPYGNDSCQRRCGDLEIPYPFGIGRGCYHYTGEGDITFQLTCRLTAGGGYHYQAFSGEVRRGHRHQRAPRRGARPQRHPALVLQPHLAVHGRQQPVVD
jgi:hypothetical protein